MAFCVGLLSGIWFPVNSKSDNEEGVD